MIRAALLAMLAASPAMAASEADWRDHECAKLAGTIEVETTLGTSVDCLTDRTAWEVEWSDGWAESIGQAMHYAREFNRRPGVIFLCKQFESICRNHERRLLLTLGSYFNLNDWDFVFVNARGEPGE